MKYLVIDAMTSTPYSGNVTPTFVLKAGDAWPTDRAMQRIANELNASETAFVGDSENCGTLLVRWFCPNQEEFLCGHGLLAAAEGVRRDRGATALKFVTSQGMLLSAEAMSSPDVVPATWKLTLPLSPVISDLKPADEYRGHFAKALGIDESLILELSCNALKDVNIELDPSVDYSAKAFTIDAMALMKASPPGTRSQVVTSAVLGDSERDFAKRVFAYGGEDQATGSTYCSLAPYCLLSTDASQITRTHQFEFACRRGQQDGKENPQGYPTIVPRRQSGSNCDGDISRGCGKLSDRSSRRGVGHGSSYERDIKRSDGMARHGV